MKSEWKIIRFELSSSKNTDTYILKQVEPILDKLDEDVAKVNGISSSPFIKFLERYDCISSFYSNNNF